MGLRMKNVNILGVHWKNQLLGGLMTHQYRGGLPKKGAWTVCQFKGCLERKTEVVLLRRGGWYPNAHFENRVKSYILKVQKSYIYIYVYMYI